MSKIMSTPVHAGSDDTPIEEALARMASVGTRHLFVISDGERVAGIFTLDDVLDRTSREWTAIGRLLERQQPNVLV